MKFTVALIIFAVIGLILGVVFGPALVLAWGVVFVFILTFISEANRGKTKKGRRQMAEERRKEEEYVNYWGSTQYWEDQEDNRD